MTLVPEDVGDRPDLRRAAYRLFAPSVASDNGKLGSPFAFVLRGVFPNDLKLCRLPDELRGWVVRESVILPDKDDVWPADVEFEMVDDLWTARILPDRPFK